MGFDVIAKHHVVLWRSIEKVTHTRWSTHGRKIDSQTLDSMSKTLISRIETLNIGQNWLLDGTRVWLMGLQD